MKNSPIPLVWIVLLIAALFGTAKALRADPIPVRHVEGVTFGFLKLRNTEGQIIADGYLKQVVTPDGASEIFTRHRSDVGMFYAEAWALVHFLAFSDHGSRAGQLPAYLRALYSRHESDPLR